MGEVIARPHGISDKHHDRAYRSVARYLLVVGSTLCGTWLVRDSVHALAARAATDDTGALLVLGLLLLGVALLLTAPRRTDPPPAIQGEGCVLLPVRRLPFVGGWLVVLLLSPFYVLMGPAEHPVNRYEAMWPLVVVGTPVLCAWLAWRLLRCDLRLRLDPDGITVPSFWREQREHVRWDGIEQVLSRRHLRPELLLVHEGEPLAFTAIDLRIPRWRAELLARVLSHYVEHPSARADLVDACALDRMFRATQITEPSSASPAMTVTPGIPS